MSLTTSNSPNSRRGRGGRRGRSGRGRGNAPAAASRPAGITASEATITNGGEASKELANGAENDEKICWICAEPVRYYALAECNHRTCHVCALRLRALYKKTDCTFCKHPQVSVIFTQSAAKDYSDFTPNDIPFSDPKLQISFETKEMMEDTMILLRFNCPDDTCDVVAHGWYDLKWHVKDKHDSILCDLCIRHKKIFAHEHTLYSHVTFSLHMPSTHSRRFTAQERADAGLPDFVHPICQFCRECFFGDDELFGHLREHHEECFVCKREGIRDQYFENYDRLEQHFKKQHFLCPHPTCMEQKFVVFPTMLDLQGHQVDVHGEQMSSRDRRDARRIETSFTSGIDRGARGGGRGGRGAGGGPRGLQANESRPGPSQARDQPPNATLQPPPQLGQPPGPASRGGGRRAAFGSSLTSEGPAASGSATPQQEASRPSPARTPEPNVDPETAEQHSQFLALLELHASTNGVTAIRGAIRSFKGSESSARDLVATIHTVLNDNMNTTSTIINALVPLFDEEKRRDILNAWNGMKIEQRDQFPSLAPTAMGSDFAGIASGRVLNVKHSTAPSAASRSRAGSSSRSSGDVWDRVERVAAGLNVAPTPRSTPAPRAGPSASAFPQLGSGPKHTTPSMSTPWSSGGQQTSHRPVIAPARAPEPPRGGSGPPAASFASSVAFPGLPSSGGSRVAMPKMSGNQSLRRIAGESPAPINVWGGGGAVSVDEPEPAPAPSDRGKGKKKGKQTLFTMGSFPN